jgi:aryl carrier-like protein
MTKPLSPSNLDGELQSDTSHVQNLLRDITADVLRIDHEDLDLDRSFLSLGGDSITAIKMMARGKAKGITLNVVDMIDTKSIRELCERACRQSPGLIANTEEIKVSEKPEESHNLSLLQKLYAETGNTEARIFSLSRGTSYNSLHGALSSLVERHPMLRAKLGRTKNGDWELQASDYTAKSFILELHAVDTEEELIGTVSKIRARLSRSHAPAFAAIVFEMTSGPRMLALAAHGAIMDTTAWQIFAKKLASQLGHDETLALHSRYFHEWPLEAIQGNGHRLSTSVQYFEKQFGIDQHDLTGSTPSKPFSESERWDVKRLVIEEHQTRLLLDQPIQSRRVVSTAADIIHSALVVAASTTTPLDEEDILFCNLNEDRSQIQLDNSLNNIGCFDVISQSHMRFSPFKDDIRRIARFNGPNLSSLIPFEDRTELQRASRQSTPPPESATTTIVVDSRRLNDNTRGAEKLVPQGESNLWFSSVHNSGSPHLSVSLVSTGKTISCSFRGNPKWHETYGLEDFVSVFKAALSGTLSRLRQTQSNAIEKIPHPAAENPARDDNLPLKQIVNSGNSAVRSIWPCSPVQEGFLISQSTNQELYQCCFVLKFVAHSMSAQRLASSWQEVVKRHAILRTMFLSSSTRPGQFDQIVLDNYFTPAIEFYDWTQQLTSQNFNSHEPVAFQPSTVPHRVHLAQASPDEVYMKLEISHALADGQSTDVIIRDLCAAYRGTQATPSVLPYGEFVEYQSQLSMEQSQAYWSKYLSNTQPTFLPMDRGHEALSDFDTLSTRLEFDENFLPEFCGRHGVTMSNVCQVAWGLVLRSFTGSSNVTFSYITSGRSAPLENLHSAVGPFVGTLICSMKFDSVTAIEDTLRRVSKDYFEAFSQPYVPDPSSSGANSKSALQLGNTTLQYQRVLDTTASTNSEIQVSVLEKSNPTDVSEGM